MVVEGVGKESFDIAEQLSRRGEVFRLGFERAAYLDWRLVSGGIGSSSSCSEREEESR